jgi:peptidoglycan/xylan/chitin deacetylase (PgdA/CDA1 family)
MTRFLRRALLAIGVLLFRFGLADFVIWRGRNRVRVLLYHSVGPDDSPFMRGVGSPIPVDVFEAHLDFVKQHYRPITLADLEEGRVPERAVLVTFDDGYRSLYTQARKPLRARGIAPTVFLIGRAVGNQELVWTNEVAWAMNVRPAEAAALVEVGCGVPEDRSVAETLHHLWSRVSPAGIQALLIRLRDALDYDSHQLAAEGRPYLDWSEIAELEREGWAFGTHTAHHFSLASMGAAEQEDEIAEGAAILGERLGHLTAFAYPFGDHDEHSRSAALRAGHRCIMEVGGVNSHPPDVTRVARVPAQGARTPAHLFAEIEVVTPAKVWARRMFRRA